MIVLSFVGARGDFNQDFFELIFDSMTAAQSAMSDLGGGNRDSDYWMHQISDRSDISLSDCNCDDFTDISGCLGARYTLHSDSSTS